MKGINYGYYLFKKYFKYNKISSGGFLIHEITNLDEQTNQYTLVDKIYDFTKNSNDYIDVQTLESLYQTYHTNPDKTFRKDKKSGRTWLLNNYNYERCRHTHFTNVALDYYIL